MANIYYKYNSIYIRFRHMKKQLNLKLKFQCLKGYSSNEPKSCLCSGCIQALAFADKVQSAVDLGSYSDEEFFPDKVDKFRSNLGERFIDIANDFMEFSDITFTTRHGYETIMRRLKKNFDVYRSIKDFKKRDIEVLRSKLMKKLSPKTIKNTLGICSAVFNRAIDNDIILKNPARGITIRAQQKEIKPFSVKELLTIIDKAYELRPVIAIYFALAGFTGLRSGEILALTRDDIDMVKMVIRVSKTCSGGRLKESTKTNNIRYVPIIEQLEVRLTEHFAYMDSKCYRDNLIVSKYGEPIIKYKSVCMVWEAVLKALKIEYIVDLITYGILLLV